MMNSSRVSALPFALGTLALAAACSAAAQSSLDIRYTPSTSPRALVNLSEPAAYADALAEAKKLMADDQTKRYVRAALLLRRDGSVVFEGYRDGISASTVHRSMSMAKSITSLAFGRAMCDKAIDLDAPVSQYVPELANHMHGSATIRQVLTMSTGGSRTNSIGWYVEQDEWLYHTQRSSGLDIVRRAVHQDVPHGSRMNYAGYNTIMLAYVVSRTTGSSFADYFRKTVWADMRAEHIGGWSTSRDGEARVTGNAYMSLRDYGRLSLYLLEVLAGTQGDACFQAYVHAATSTQIKQTELPHVLYKGYGYQIWTAHSSFGPKSFAFLGYLGQRIYIDPERGVVTVLLVDGPPEAEQVLVGYGNRMFMRMRAAAAKQRAAAD